MKIRQFHCTVEGIYKLRLTKNGSHASFPVCARRSSEWIDNRMNSILFETATSEPSASAVLDVSREPCGGVVHAEFCFVFRLDKKRRPRMCGHHAQNLRSPQLFYVLTMKFMHTPSQLKHWFRGRWVCQTCSAAPATSFPIKPYSGSFPCCSTFS